MPRGREITNEICQSNYLVANFPFFSLPLLPHILFIDFNSVSLGGEKNIRPVMRRDDIIPMLFRCATDNDYHARESNINEEFNLSSNDLLFDFFNNHFSFRYNSSSVVIEGG